MKNFVFGFALLLVSLTSFAQGSGGYTMQDQVDALKRRQSVAVTSVTSGTATTINNTTGSVWVRVNPASTLAAHVITLPSAPANGHTVQISFGGALTSGTVVTSLTISPAASQTIVQSSTPSSATAGTSLAYRFDALLSKWLRLF